MFQVRCPSLKRHSFIVSKAQETQGMVWLRRVGQEPTAFEAWVLVLEAAGRVDTITAVRMNAPLLAYQHWGKTCPHRNHKVLWPWTNTWKLPILPSATKTRHRTNFSSFFKKWYRNKECAQMKKTKNYCLLSYCGIGLELRWIRYWI